MSQAEMDIDQQLLDLFGKLRTEIGRFNFMGILLKSIDIPTNSLVNLISALAKQVTPHLIKDNFLKISV